MSTLQDTSAVSNSLVDVQLSIDKINDIQKAAQKRKNSLEDRIFQVNEVIKKAKITAHLNLLKTQEK